MSDMASIEIVLKPFDLRQLAAHAVIKDGFLNFLLNDSLPFFLFVYEFIIVNFQTQFIVIRRKLKRKPVEANHFRESHSFY